MASKPPPWSNIPAEQTEVTDKKPNGLPSLQSVINNSIDATQSHKSLHVISPGGDLVLEYVDESSNADPVRWQVASENLARKSPYFSALLDPEKFAEGRRFAQQKQGLNGHAEPELAKQDSNEWLDLPKIQIPALLVIKLCGSEALSVFLQALCLESMTESAAESFRNSIKNEPPSVVAKFIQIADAFNSPSVAFSLLHGKYLFGRRDNTRALRRFDRALLKMKEDRVRQVLMIAIFLQEYAIARTMMHTMTLSGSRSWTCGVEVPSGEYLQWQYLPSGIEGNPYCKHQFLLGMNAYF